jgi:hypothetical protein
MMNNHKKAKIIPMMVAIMKLIKKMTKKDQMSSILIHKIQNNVKENFTGKNTIKLQIKFH